MYGIYRDGASDLASRIKTKFMEYVDYLRGKESAIPVVRMLLRVIKLSSEVNSPTNGKSLVKNIKRLHTARKDLAILFNPKRLVKGEEFDVKGRLAWLSAGRKIVLGSIQAFVGYLTDEIIEQKFNL